MRKVVRMAADVWMSPPVLTMVAAWSGFIAAVLLPSRTTGDLLAGMWQLLSGSFGGVPKTLVWDNEAGIGQHRRLTVAARAFAGTLGTQIYQTRPRDPEAKGVVERANGFLHTSFLPGREFGSSVEFNTQLGAWLPRANQLSTTGQNQPGMAPVVAPSHAITGAHPHQPRRRTARAPGSRSVKYSLVPDCEILGPQGHRPDPLGHALEARPQRVRRHLRRPDARARGQHPPLTPKIGQSRHRVWFCGVVSARPRWDGTLDR